MNGMGLKDGSKKGMKMGGLGRNKTKECRHPKLKEDAEETNTVAKKVIQNVIGE